MTARVGPPTRTYIESALCHSGAVTASVVPCVEYGRRSEGPSRSEDPARGFVECGDRFALIQDRVVEPASCARYRDIPRDFRFLEKHLTERSGACLNVRHDCSFLPVAACKDRPLAFSRFRDYRWDSPPRETAFAAVSTRSEKRVRRSLHLLERGHHQFCLN